MFVTKYGRERHREMEGSRAKEPNARSGVFFLLMNVVTVCAEMVTYYQTQERASSCSKRSGTAKQSLL